MKATPRSRDRRDAPFLGPDATPRTCSTLHRVLWSVALIMCAATILLSEAALLMGRWEWTFWPWNRGWFMFSSTDGYFHSLDVKGRFEDGTERPVRMSRWFRYPVGHETRRYDEIGRDTHDLLELVGYVCQRANEDAVSGERLVAVTIGDRIWPQERGRRRRFEEVEPSRRLVKTLVSNVTCP